MVDPHQGCGELAQASETNDPNNMGNGYDGAILQKSLSWLFVFPYFRSQFQIMWFKVAKYWLKTHFCMHQLLSSAIFIFISELVVPRIPKRPKHVWTQLRLRRCDQEKIPKVRLVGWQLKLPFFPRDDGSYIRGSERCQWRLQRAFLPRHKPEKLRDMGWNFKE